MNWAVLSPPHNACSCDTFVQYLGVKTGGLEAIQCLVAACLLLSADRASNSKAGVSEVLHKEDSSIPDDITDDKTLMMGRARTLCMSEALPRIVWRGWRSVAL